MQLILVNAKIIRNETPQLGALQDHNARVSAFNEYEQSLIHTTARQDRSIKAIRKAEDKARMGMDASRIRSLGQQARFAMATKHVWIEMQQDVLLGIKQCKIFLMWHKNVSDYTQGLLTNGY